MLFPGCLQPLSAVPGGITLVTVVWLLGTLATAHLQSMDRCMYVCVLAYLKIFE